MDSSSPPSGDSPPVQPSAPQRQPGDTVGSTEAAVSPTGSDTHAQEPAKPSFHPWTAEEALDKIWAHLGLDKHYSKDEEQPA